MSSPPPPGVYQIRNATTGHFLVGFTRIGNAVQSSAGTGQMPGRFLLSKEGDSYRLSLFKFGGPEISVGIENGEKLLWIPGRGDPWTIRPLIGSLPPAYQVFIAEDNHRHWVEDAEKHEVFTLDSRDNSAWEFIPNRDD